MIIKERLCYHCGLSVNYNNLYTVYINNKNRLMCCIGCKVVAETIMKHGLSKYYNFRENYNLTADVNNNDILNKISLYKDNNVSKKFISNIDGKLNSSIFIIDGITCSACVWLLEQSILKLNGIYEVTVSLSTYRAKIIWDSSVINISTILKNILHIGYKAYPYKLKQEELLNKAKFDTFLKKICVSGLGMMQVMMFAIALYAGEFNDIELEYKYYMYIVSFIVTTPVMFYSGSTFFFSAYRGLKQKKINMDFTVSLALFFAYFFSVYMVYTKGSVVYFDSVCMFIFFLTLGRFLELKAKYNAFNTINKLLLSCPVVVNLLKKIDNDSYIEKIISIDDVSINDEIIVKVGEVIPMDSILLDDIAIIDESILTGEEFPITKKFGNRLYGGSQNINKPIRIKIKKLKNDSQISHINKLIEYTTTHKPHIVILANKVASLFVWAVLVLTLFIGIFWIYKDIDKVIPVILSVLVVTCPCALSLATPIAMTASMFALAQNGMLISKKHVLEGLTLVTHIVFDKTGTLTENKFELKNVYMLNKSVNLNVIEIAYNLEKNILHPISTAFINNIENKNILIKQVKNITYLPNMGIEGEIGDDLYRIGKRKFSLNLCSEKFSSFTPKTEYIYVLLTSKKNGPLAWFELYNKLRDDAKESIDILKNSNLKIHLLTGDSSKSVKYLSKHLDINNIVYNANIETKINYIKKLQKNKSTVLMIGDGINDAPALNQSHISISMGSGADITKSKSDAVLLYDKLKMIPYSIKHAKKTKKIIIENFIWALLYNFSMVPLAACGLIEPYFAAIGMSLSSLFVVLNSLRLRNLFIKGKKKW